MEILTNYEFTIDVISNANDAVETFGTEAGFGIISPKKALAWVAANCPSSCPRPVVSHPDPHTVPARVQARALAPAPAPASFKPNINYRGCYVDFRRNRILEEDTVEETMSAEVCLLCLDHLAFDGKAFMEVFPWISINCCLTCLVSTLTVRPRVLAYRGLSFLHFDRFALAFVTMDCTRSTGPKMAKR